MSSKSSPRYDPSNPFSLNNTDQQPEKDSYINVKEIGTDYIRVSDHTESLKLEQSHLKHNTELALNEIESDISEPIDSSYMNVSNMRLKSPKNMEKRLLELEYENQELKSLLEENSQRILKLQRDNQANLVKIHQLEVLRYKNKELKGENDFLNQELSTVTDKLFELEDKSKNTTIQSPKDIGIPEKESLLKYTNYIYQLINSTDKNHFAYCCFEERFLKGKTLVQLVKANDQFALLTRAFKYITDLLMNILSSCQMNSPTSCKTIPTPYNINRMGENHLKLGDLSCITDNAQDQNTVPQMESPHIYDMTTLIGKPVGYLPIKQFENRIDKDNLRKQRERASFNQASDLESSCRDHYEHGYEQLGVKNMDNVGLSPRKLVQKPEAEEYISVAELEPGPNSEKRRQLKAAISKNLESPIKEVNSQRFDSNIESEDAKSSKSISKEKMTKVDHQNNKDVLGRFRELREKCRELKEKEKTESLIGSRQCTDELIESKGKLAKTESRKTEEDLSEDNPNEPTSNYIKDYYVSSLKGGSSTSIKSPGVIKKNGVNPLSESAKNLTPSQSKNGIEANNMFKSKNSMLIPSHSRDDFRSQPPSELSENPTDSKRNSQKKLSNSFLSPKMKGSKGAVSYQQLNEAKRQNLESRDTSQLSQHSRRGNIYSSTTALFDTKGIGYSTHTVSFWKTEARLRTSPSPSKKVSSITDVPHKKKVSKYPAQSYDVIKGHELVRKKYIDQSGIMESEVVTPNRRLENQVRPKIIINESVEN